MTIEAAGFTSAGELTGAQRSKLESAAREFEAMMVSALLKPLHFGASVEDAGEADAGGASATVQSFGNEALGKALAAHGGFGLARQIVRQVTAERTAVEKKQEGSKVR